MFVAASCSPPLVGNVSLDLPHNLRALETDVDFLCPKPSKQTFLLADRVVLRRDLDTDIFRPFQSWDKRGAKSAWRVEGRASTSHHQMR
ncbi:hypothetical protein RRG08_038952, partial [Elysia crispata]